jgi:phosphatidylglycerol:prolipoprotein diacylglycerol transferase
MANITMDPGRVYYALFMSMALAAFYLVRRLLPKGSSPIAKLSFREQFVLATAAFAGGMLSAKIPFVLSASGESGWIISWATDGKTVTAGLVGAYLSVEAAKWLLGIRFKTGDSFALPLAVALSIGRIGCFFNGCCYGIATELPWGIDFHGLGHMHPTQLYEVLFHGILAVFLWRLTVTNQLATHRLQFYLISYCIFRFVTETIRPEPIFAIGLTIYQWTMLLFGVFLAIQWYCEVWCPTRSVNR